MPLRCSVRLILAAAIAGFTSACGGDDDGGDAAAGAWKAGQEWRLTPVDTIGAVEGTGPEVFAQIVDVELDPLGRVWVADGQQHQIRVFDSAGAHVRTIGRKGGGPREFNGIAGMDWAADGTLWVLDGGNMRFAVYDTAGRFITTHRRDVNITVTPWPLGFDSRGNLYDRASVTSHDDPDVRVVRFGPGLQPRDTFRVPPFEAPVFEVAREQGGNRSITRVNIPFSPDQVWRLDPEGFVWVNVTDRYRLTRYRFDGTVERVVERPAKARPVTAQQRKQILDRYRGFEQSGGRVDESRIPKTHPVIINFFVADDGHLWVMPYAGSPARMDIFAPGGTYLGEVSVPGRPLPSPVPAVRGGRMAAVWSWTRTRCSPSCSCASRSPDRSKPVASAPGRAHHPVTREMVDEDGTASRRGWMIRTIGGMRRALFAWGGAAMAIALLASCGGGHVPLPALSASTVGDTAGLVARGEYIVRNVAVCGHCHAADPRNSDGPLSGGYAFRDWRLGTIRASNLTPDVETGLGAWSEAEIVRAIRSGQDREGRVLAPVMPYAWFRGMSERDALAIARYLKSLPPVRNPVRNQPSLVYRAARTFSLRPMRPTASVVPRPAADAEYGRYLANHVSLCGDCHMPRGGLQQKPDLDRPFAGDATSAFPANPANLTPDEGTGIGRWTEDDFLRALRTGVNPRGDSIHPFMPWRELRRMRDDDQRAIYRYLRTLPAIRNPVPEKQAPPPAG